MTDKPQIIRTPGGESMVVLPLAEYESLLAAAASTDDEAEDAEDAADLATYHAAKAAISAGDRLVTPPEVAALLLKGNGLLTAFRKFRGVSQSDLAKRIGMGQGYLSDLENKRRAGTAATLGKIAAALEIDPRWLLP